MSNEEYEKILQKIQLGENVPIDVDDDFVDDEEIDADLQFQLLKKDYEKRTKLEEQKIKQQELIKDSKISDFELQEYKEKAHNYEKYFLIDKYMFSYKKYIKENDLLGKCSMHYILGQMIRDSKIYLNDKRWLDPRVHIALIQLSGSGKGETASFVESVLKDVKMPLNKNNPDTLVIPKVFKGGDFTAQSMINTYKTSKNGVTLELDKNKQPIKIIGNLERYNYIIEEESQSLFNGKTDTLEKLDHYMKAMEPIDSSNNVITKRLTQYDVEVTTKPIGSYFFMTRPLGKMNTKIADSGLFQRCLFIPREIPSTIVSKMQKDKTFDTISYMAGDIIEDEQEIYNEMIEEFKRVIKFAYTNEISLDKSNSKKIIVLLHTLTDELINDIEENIPLEEIQNTLLSQTNRYFNNIYRIAYHCACMRYSTIITLSDFQYAINIIKELYQMQKEWLSESIDMPYYDVKNLTEIKNYLISTIKKDVNKLKNMDKITREIGFRFNINYDVCFKKIVRFSKGTYKVIRIETPISPDSKVYLIDNN